VGHALPSDQEGAQPPGPVRLYSSLKRPTPGPASAGPGVPTMTSTTVNLVLLPGPSWMAWWPPSSWNGRATSARAERETAGTNTETLRWVWPGLSQRLGDHHHL